MLYGDSGVSWTIYKSLAPDSIHITMPAPHHSIFYRPDALPKPNKQYQSNRFIDLWKSGVQQWTYAMLFRAKFQLYWCILLPLLGKKQQFGRYGAPIATRPIDQSGRNFARESEPSTTKFFGITESCNQLLWVQKLTQVTSDSQTKQPP